MAFRNADNDRNVTDVSHWGSGGNVWSGEQMYGYRRNYQGYLAPNQAFRPGPFTGIGPRNYHPSDEYILDEIVRRLTWSGQLNAAGINVNVKDGEVTLSGSVDSRKDKRMAEDIADTVGGVVDVHNELMIKHQQNQGQ